MNATRARRHPTLLARSSCLITVVILGLTACEPELNPTSLPDEAGETYGNNGDAVLKKPDGPPGAQGPSFIVTLRDNADPASVAGAYGVRPKHLYGTALNGFAGGMSEAARSGLMRDARVLRIEKDLEVTTMSEQPNAPWGLDRIDQRSSELNGIYAYTGTGAGVTAYIVDTGVLYSHAEFGGRARFGFDARGEDGVDCHGHGTHVAGTVGGSTYGVAKGVDLVGVRVLDCNGSGSFSDVIAGLDWVAANASGPSVVNMSLGGSATEALDQAVQSLVDAGVSVAVAAGNNGGDACAISPARAPNAMTVGASDPNDIRASFSNFGTCVDWFAPGVNVLSAHIGSDGATATFSGTSMAAPHTAGAAALLLESDPSMTPQAVSDALWSYSTKNVVADAFTENAHVLSTLRDHQEDVGDPPPEFALVPPANLILTISTEYPAYRLTWQVNEPRAQRVDIAAKWPGQDEWFIFKSLDVFYTSIEGGLEPSTEYEFSVRTKEWTGTGSTGWRYSEWAPSVFGRSCDVSGGGSNAYGKTCSSNDSGGGTDGGSDGGTDGTKGNKGGNGKGNGKKGT